MDTILAHIHLRGSQVFVRALGAVFYADKNDLALSRNGESHCLKEVCQSCTLTADAPPEARPISASFDPAGEARYSFYVDFRSRI